MFKTLLMFLGGFDFIKTVYKLFDNPWYMYPNGNPHLLCTILERDMMSLFPNCVRNVRVQALRKYTADAEFFFNLLSCDLTTP